LKPENETEAECQQHKFTQWPKNGQVGVRINNQLLNLLGMGRSYIRDKRNKGEEEKGTKE
jgi:hypothetical protein